MSTCSILNAIVQDYSCKASTPMIWLVISTADPHRKFYLWACVQKFYCISPVHAHVWQCCHQVNVLKFCHHVSWHNRNHQNRTFSKKLSLGILGIIYVMRSLERDHTSLGILRQPTHDCVQMGLAFCSFGWCWSRRNEFCLISPNAWLKIGIIPEMPQDDTIQVYGGSKSWSCLHHHMTHTMMLFFELQALDCPLSSTWPEPSKCCLRLCLCLHISPKLQIFVSFRSLLDLIGMCVLNAPTDESKDC